jgi:hypothetical protein
MAWFGSVSGKQVDAFARSLVAELAGAYPPTREKSEEKFTDRKVFSALDTIYGKARDFKEQHKLGVYKTARLANTFRWELQETGYSAQFVEFATEGLVVRTTHKSRE